MIFLVFLLSGSALHAEELADGEKLYKLHCASCHGAQARGLGPMVPALRAAPTDLTQLSVTNGGSFPTVKIIERLEGRAPLAAHGGTMPIFGYFFSGSPVSVAVPNSKDIQTSEPIADLITWLRTVQRN